MITATVLNAVAVDLDLEKLTLEQRKESFIHEYKKEKVRRSIELKNIEKQRMDLDYSIKQEEKRRRLRDKIETIREEKNLINQMQINIDNLGRIGNYLVGRTRVWGDKELTPYGTLNLKENKVGSYYIASSDLKPSLATDGSPPPPEPPPAPSSLPPPPTSSSLPGSSMPLVNLPPPPPIKK